MRRLVWTALAFALVACGGSTPQAAYVNPDSTSLALHGSPHGYKSIHDFGGKQGATPMGFIQGGNDGMFLTTSSGGDATHCSDGCGTIVEDDNVIYRFAPFAKDSDGTHPLGGVAILGNALFGTRASGGAGCPSGAYGPGCGTIFKVTASSGKEQILYRFKGGTDGQEPHATLIGITNGNVYGTTKYGGDPSCGGGVGCGTVFELTPTGKERVLYAFKGGADGAYPEARLLVVGSSTMYGSTTQGGTGCGSIGCGTIFSVTPDGDELVVYRFKGGMDGSDPSSGLTSANGVLYGVTRFGGDIHCGTSGSGCGTFYRLSSLTKEFVRYRFHGAPDGAHPAADLTSFSGEIYGTTEFGGANDDGTIFRLGPKKPAIMYSFKGGSDGANPLSSLTIDFGGGPIYGTTAAGGSGCASGCGTTYQINE